MEEQSILQIIENCGYFLLPKSHTHSPGYSGLLVAIRAQPTGKHFDPQWMRLWLHWLRDEHEETRWAKLWIDSPTELSIRGSIQVCPGWVVLGDRRDKKVSFFTFGGSLEATSVPGETVYSLRSPAPVLQITEKVDGVPEQLAAETEELIGRLRAKWGVDEEECAKRCAQVDPLQFYVATVNSILTHYEQHHALQEASHEFYLALRNEKKWLVNRGHWPIAAPVLETLLAPTSSAAG